MAAVLASGEGAVLSHRDAAAAWGIRQSNRRPVEVTVPGRRRSPPRLQLHFAHLPADEVTTVRGIPITTVPRTIFDLAAVLPRRHVERAIHEAEVRRLYDPLSLDDLIARHPGSRGVATVRAIVADATRGSGVTRQELEALFLDFVERVGLPRPELNQIVEVGDRSFECDCVWREQQLIVELDGRHVHGTPRNYESDRERDRLLTVHEWRVIRITWLHLHRDADEVARDLRAILAGPPSAAQPRKVRQSAQEGRSAGPPFIRMLDPPWPRTPRSSSASSR
jgi:hypothetical protein